MKAALPYLVSLLILVVLFTLLVVCFIGKPKENYYRFQSNMCHPQSNIQPITLPGPRGIAPPKLRTEYDALVCAQKYGNMAGF